MTNYTQIILRNDYVFFFFFFNKTNKSPICGSSEFLFSYIYIRIVDEVVYTYENTFQNGGHMTFKFLYS